MYALTLVTVNSDCDFMVSFYFVKCIGSLVPALHVNAKWQ